MFKRCLLVVLFALIFGFLAVQVVNAQQPTPSDDQVNKIAKQLYCPVCENIPLDVCPTTACAQWRELIRQKLAEGKTEQEIKDFFVQQYGARVIGIPPPTGINWLVYVLPPLIIIAGIYVLYRGFRSWQRPAEKASPSTTVAEPPSGLPSSQDDYIKQLEDQVRKH